MMKGCMVSHMTVTNFYNGLFGFSLILTVIYIYMWHKHFEVNFTIIFALLPVSCLGYAMGAWAENMESAVMAVKVSYIGGCYLQMFIALSIFNLCQVEITRWQKVGMFALCTIFYLAVLTIGYSDVFYKDMSFQIEDGAGILTRHYGYMHTAFYVVVCLFFMGGFATIIYSWFRKKQIPRGILLMLIIADIICLLCFFIGRRVLRDIDIVPAGYCMATVMYMLIAHRMNLYDISDTVIDSMVQEGEIGYISFDFGCRYLGSNEVAKRLIPALNEMAVDEPLGDRPSMDLVRGYLDRFRKDPADHISPYELPDPDGDKEKDKFYNVNVSFLYDGFYKRGYTITFTDDTSNQKYIRLVKSFNEDLHQQVDEKTRHIVEMHDNLIMSLAAMVESRDNSTGGHIRRTSQGVNILVDEIRKEGTLSLSDEFCRDVIKAAPMHDLGKIAVDDAVLRKPGRFTPEEFEMMKHHAAEGARVIHQILLHTDDESFKELAENVAHYHHERWDGSGYPEGLAGEQIPIEARIMAIADVYDALVSKRVYKDAYDFSKADSIIMEGMGTQFDPGLRTVYENARPRLEEYYGSLTED